MQIRSSHFKDIEAGFKSGWILTGRKRLRLTLCPFKIPLMTGGGTLTEDSTPENRQMTGRCVSMGDDAEQTCVQGLSLS